MMRGIGLSEIAADQRIRLRVRICGLGRAAVMEGGRRMVDGCYLEQHQMGPATVPLPRALLPSQTTDAPYMGGVLGKRSLAWMHHLDATELHPECTHQFVVITGLATSLSQLRQQIHRLYQKLYPGQQDIEVLRLRDEEQCDLDDDYVVGEVFHPESFLYALCQYGGTRMERVKCKKASSVLEMPEKIKTSNRDGHSIGHIPSTALSMPIKGETHNTKEETMRKPNKNGEEKDEKKNQLKFHSKKQDHSEAEGANPRISKKKTDKEKRNKEQTNKQNGSIEVKIEPPLTSTETTVTPLVNKQKSIMNGLPIHHKKTTISKSHSSPLKDSSNATILPSTRQEPSPSTILRDESVIEKPTLAIPIQEKLIKDMTSSSSESDFEEEGDRLAAKVLSSHSKDPPIVPPREDKPTHQATESPIPPKAPAPQVITTTDSDSSEDEDEDEGPLALAQLAERQGSYPSLTALNEQLKRDGIVAPTPPTTNTLATIPQTLNKPLTPTPIKTKATTSIREKKRPRKTNPP